MALLLCSSPAWCAWTKVNDQVGSAAADPEAAPAFTNPLTNGSVIIVGCFNLNNNNISVTDTATNTYKTVDTNLTSGRIAWKASANSIELFYALNTHTTASNVVSCHGGAGAFTRVEGTEYTCGGCTISVHSSSSTANGTTVGTTGQNVTSGTVTASSGDLLYGFAGITSGTLSTGTGFTALANPSAEFLTASGSAAATWNDDTSGDTYGAIGASFSAGGAAAAAIVPQLATMGVK